jgi:conjugative relaxase-like TrwC/TraI family protein
MLNLAKMGATVGDKAAALRKARYLLDRPGAPAKFRKGRRQGNGEEEPERANSMWLGSEKGLAQLGLHRGGEVAEGELALVMQGLHAVTGKQVRRPGIREVRDRESASEAAEVRRAGAVVLERRVNNVDLTFSAPKSVSVVWSQASEGLRLKIEQAMMVATNAMLEYMTGTKPVIQGERGPASGFVASASLHPTARRAHDEEVPSPQLHVHALLVGVLDANGKLKTAATDALFKRDAPLAGGAVARAVLAEELRKLGFQIEWGTGKNGRFFEIRGVPQELVEEWSARTREVENEVARLEQAMGEKLTGRQRAVVAQLTRMAKEDMSPEDIQEVWDRVASRAQFREQEVNALVGGAEERIDPDWLSARAREEILARIWRYGPTVSPAMVDAIVYEIAPMGMSVEDANRLLRQMEQAGELIALEGGRVTTREIRQLERTVLSIATAAASRPGARVSSRALSHGIDAAQRKLGPEKPLDEEQLRAIEQQTRGTAWGTLTGFAGTGKGPVLHAVAEAHRADGWKVVACAIDGSTAQRLGHQIDAQAYTIEQVLNAVEKGTLRIDDRTLIVVEEASKVGLRHWGKLAELTREFGNHLLAVGHTGQLGAIELPGMFAELIEAEAVEHSKLTKIRRHRDPLDPQKEHPWLGEYQLLLDKGDVKAAERAISMLREHGAITMHETRGEAMRALVAQWDHRRRNYKDPRDAILVVHGPNEDVDRVNEMAQQCRLENHELSGDSVEAADRSFRLYAGDVVMLRVGPYRPERDDFGEKHPRRLENGTVGIVRSVDARRGVVNVWVQEPGRDERVVEVSRDKLRAQGSALRLAYAFHPFPLQGATAKDVGVLDGHWSQYKEATYTADTRPELYLYKHVDRETLGTENTEAECWALLAKRWATSQNIDASIRWEQMDDRIAAALPNRAWVPRLGIHDEQADVRAMGALIGARTGPIEIGVGVANPLAGYREVLGERRVRWLEEQARAIQREVAGWELAKLNRRAALAERAMRPLDRGNARESRRIERDRAIAQQQIDRARKQIHALQADLAGEHEAREKPRKISARERREIAERIQVLERQQIQGQRVLRGLAGSEQNLRRRNQHLDQWLATDGKRAALWIALHRERAFRHELAVASVVQWSLEDPGRPLVDLVGPPPSRSDPERREWEALVQEIEHERLSHRVPSPGSAQDRSVHARRGTERRGRVERLREHRGLAPLDPVTLDRATPATELE